MDAPISDTINIESFLEIWIKRVAYKMSITGFIMKKINKCQFTMEVLLISCKEKGTKTDYIAMN